MDVSKSFCGESVFFFKSRRGKVSWVKKLADLLGSKYLLEILKTSPTTKNSKNLVKRGYFEKWRAPPFLEIKEGYKVFCVAKLVGDWYSLKYCTPHPLWKL